MFASLFALVLQVSQLVQPLELSESPPETRSIAVVRFDPGHEAEAAAWRDKAVRSREFEAFARQLAVRPVPGARAMFGTVWRGLLDDALEPCVFDTPPGAVATPDDSDDRGELVVVQHIERDAACRQIFISNHAPNARVRADAILRELQAGADFAQIARERSDDRASALRGGDLAIFERGPRDMLLRAAAFDAQLGEIVGPIESPLGFHILQRVAVDSLAPRLRDDVWARARGLRIAFAGAEGSLPTVEREHDAAQELAERIARRIRLGEDMAALAREFDDDRGGRERAGDLGWVRRQTTIMPGFFDRLFIEAPGTLIGPLPTTGGFVLLRREDPGPRSRVVVGKNPFLQFELEVRGGAIEVRDEVSDYARVAALGRELSERMDAADGGLGLDSWILRCTNAQEWLELAQTLPETVRTRAGVNAPLRELGIEYARGLVGLEARYAAEFGPARERTNDGYAARLRERLTLLGDNALDILLGDLGFSDPRIGIEVHLVAGNLGAPWHFRYARGVEGHLDVLLAADGLDDDAVMHLAVHAIACSLTAVARDADSVPRALAKLEFARNGSVRVDELHGLICVEAAHVLDEVFDVRTPPFVFAGGWRSVEGLRGGGRLTPNVATAETTPVERAVTEAWRSYLAGAKSRAETIRTLLVALE